MTAGTSAPSETLDGPVLRAEGLAKSFGPVPALSGVDLLALPGRVTGFVGPNGAGKSTTLRILTGLVRADRGTATIDEVPYAALSRPSQVLGVVGDLAGAHPGMTPRGHLQTQAALIGVPREWVGQVLHETGLHDVAGRRIRGFSTGMKQRLALATALLGRPSGLILDEPTEGLDPSGIVWLRRFLRTFADAGGTVLVSSHVLTELQQVIDDLVLIAGGRSLWSGSLADFTAEHASLEEAYLSMIEKEMACAG
ncbi:ABC-2 type transport system ATP-binding protein [Nocardioides luteus]|uniref:ABC transporter n=1 Tax=Nocardioides luteus TaxID=1844 RepID=A0ABQ5SVQ3_9ACTN|nr:ATP-binding cassette domain-containing protein [Nocardioides luteus]MDR7312031.1 ABC-2 type transport system ATP-binding protein [Nocardioides luteus]GGR72082.1 ABC transporter [Nocardioides luteus]GLJ68277.1 ABC transporter [Nocardioides luteus]